jgi:hypothetical protein
VCPDRPAADDGGPHDDDPTMTAHTMRATSDKISASVEERLQQAQRDFRSSVSVALQKLLASLAAGFLLLAVCLGPAWRRYGIHFFLPLESQMLSLSTEEWSREVLPNKTLVLLGGHHRAGTTLLWQLLRTHAALGSFSHRSGVDYSEGVFLQDVLPDFGVGSLEARWSGGALINGNTSHGVGTYALSSPAAVHWTEHTHTARLTLELQARLLNQWGYHWQCVPPCHSCSPMTATKLDVHQSVMQPGH